MNRKPEFHLYLYTLEGYKRDVINAYTVTAVNDLIALGKDVDTYQLICCTTDLFNQGYRIFIHETPASQFEITLGQCEGTTREIKVGHDLPKLILAGEFTCDDSNTIPYKDFHVPDFYEDGFPPTTTSSEKLSDRTKIQEIREIIENIKNIVYDHKNQSGEFESLVDPDKKHHDFIENTIKDKEAIQHYATCTIDLTTGVSHTETVDDEDPDTAIWRLYEQAYPNNNGLPDISYMDDREDVVHYD